MKVLASLLATAAALVGGVMVANATVRKPRNPVRNNGRGRQCVQRHPGRGNTRAQQRAMPVIGFLNRFFC
jgi:hypothetical protein